MLRPTVEGGVLVEAFFRVSVAAMGFDCVQKPQDKSRSQHLEPVDHPNVRLINIIVLAVAVAQPHRRCCSAGSGSGGAASGS